MTGRPFPDRRQFLKRLAIPADALWVSDAVPVRGRRPPPPTRPPRTNAAARGLVPP
jgi:hypothetical protein